jgi:hypothetical protein
LTQQPVQRPVLTDILTEQWPVQTLSVPHYWPPSQKLRTQTGNNLWRYRGTGDEPASCCGTVRSASLSAFKTGYSVVRTPRYAIKEDSPH